MHTTCIVVDLRHTQEDFAADLTDSDLAGSFVVAPLQDVPPILTQDQAVVLIAFADDWNDRLSQLLEHYTRSQGPISRFVGIVCDEPDANLTAGVFEFGVDHFMAKATWIREAEAMLRRAEAMLAENVSELHAIRVAKAIHAANQEHLKNIHHQIKAYMAFDYLAAYCVGRAREARGDFKGAVNALQLSTQIYPNFRPSQQLLAENLLIMNQATSALAILQNLELGFSQEVGRKSLLVSACLALGELERAQEYLREAEAISQTHPRVIEAQVQLLLAEGNIDEALTRLDRVTNAGALFASRLNEVGIELSQSKRGASALALYEKAHRIVRPELKYKISLNAALAAHRVGDFAQALAFVKRTEQEYGTTFDKLKKIRQVVETRLAKGGEDAA